ncbi:hypothetical protein [Endozoicomonas sp. Mp262]|uniref:hypothetical protein n=1 Tax=Endozoicomonas sp. Mp262 TaxID=2919499 RepID=UPI0021DA76AB
MSSEWLTATVVDFCRLMGFSVEALPVMIEFEKRGTLSIEGHGEQLLVIMTRPVFQDVLADHMRKAMSLCHYRRQSFFTIQAAMHGDDRIAFIARLEGDDISVTNLERVVKWLTRMHDQLL